MPPQDTEVASVCQPNAYEDRRKVNLAAAPQRQARGHQATLFAAVSRYSKRAQDAAVIRSVALEVRGGVVGAVPATIRYAASCGSGAER